jgi:hypothetical protein
LFNRNDRLPGDADLIGEFLLHHLPEGARLQLRN